MMASWPAAYAFLRMAEGGFVVDDGGPTMDGITLTTLRRHFPNATEADLKAMSTTEVEGIYRADYWHKVDGDCLPAGLDLMLFDEAVNAGPGRSIELLQRTLGIAADGVIGPITLGAIAPWDTCSLIGHLAAAQAEYYRGLNDFALYGKGWLHRVAARQAAALVLATKPGGPHVAAAT